jgi:putative membrane protein
MMDGYDMGGGWVLMIIAWAALLAVIVWAVLRVAPGREASSSLPTERPLQILDRRLANGDLDVETYDRLRTKLKGGYHEAPRAGTRDA